MRIVLVLCLLLTMTACAGWDDPAVLRSQADAIERQYRQATAQARAYAAEQEAQSQAATAEAENRARSEIELILAAGGGTATAIINRQNELDITMLEAEKTREAVEYGVSATSTAQAAQATQTALALAVAYEPTRIAQAQMRDDIINRGLSLSLIVLMVLLVVFMVILTIIGIIICRYVYLYLTSRVKWQNNKHMFVHTPDGTMVVNKNGEVSLARDDGYLRRKVREIRQTTEIEEAEHIPSSLPIVPPVERADPLAVLALNLLDQLDDDAIDIPGWRELEDWNSQPWQKATGYLYGLGYAIQKPDRTYALRASVREVRYQLLTSPTPMMTRKNG